MPTVDTLTAQHLLKTVTAASRMGEFLVATMQVDRHDRLVSALQDDLTNKIAEWGSQGVLIDISTLDIVDSSIGRMIGNIAGMSPILDAETVIVGMQPAVAITLVELGLSLPVVRTALNVEKGMDLLRAAIRGRRWRFGSRTTSSSSAKSCGDGRSNAVSPLSTRPR